MSAGRVTPDRWKCCQSLAVKSGSEKFAPDAAGPTQSWHPHEREVADSYICHDGPSRSSERVTRYLEKAPRYLIHYGEAAGCCPTSHRERRYCRSGFGPDRPSGTCSGNLNLTSAI